MQNSIDFLRAIQLRYPLQTQASQSADNSHYEHSRRRARLTWLLAGFLALFGSVAQAADAWTTTDTASEAVYQILSVIDWGQTLDIARHPGYTETNPITGKNPTRGRINAYFLSNAVLHPLITHYLPTRVRPFFQCISIGIEIDAVQHNASVGLHLAF